MLTAKILCRLHHICYYIVVVGYAGRFIVMHIYVKEIYIPSILFHEHDMLHIHPVCKELKGWPLLFIAQLTALKLNK